MLHAYVWWTRISSRGKLPHLVSSNPRTTNMRTRTCKLYVHFNNRFCSKPGNNISWKEWGLEISSVNCRTAARTCVLHILQAPTRECSLNRARRRWADCVHSASKKLSLPRAEPPARNFLDEDIFRSQPLRLDEFSQVKEKAIASTTSKRAQENRHR